MREILFYGFVGDFLVRQFIMDLTSVGNTAEGAFIKINSSGGSVFAGWGMISEFRDFKNAKKVLVHGNASSMMSVFLLFADDTECIEQSKFVLHRASLGFEENMSKTDKELLISINADIRKAFEDKLDIRSFEEIAGVNLDRFFDITFEPVDVVLNASQAKAIGLIKSVKQMKANEADELNRAMIAACGSSNAGIQLINTSEINSNFNNNEMKLKEFKTKHPEAYAELVAEQLALTPSAVVVAPVAVASEESGVEAQNRVNTWLAWGEVDPKAVAEGIKSGVAITSAQIAEFTVQGLKDGFFASSEGSSVKPVVTATVDPGKTTKEEEVEAFSASLNSMLGLPKEN